MALCWTSTCSDAFDCVSSLAPEILATWSSPILSASSVAKVYDSGRKSILASLAGVDEVDDGADCGGGMGSVLLAAVGAAEVGLLARTRSMMDSNMNTGKSPPEEMVREPGLSSMNSGLSLISQICLE